VKSYTYIVICIAWIASGCSGSKKYFKAAERLEKQGLVNEAADYYLQSLQRKSTNVEARIKLKEVGQKYVSSLASEFFRNYNTQQTEASIETFDRITDFTSKTNALNVTLDYPKAYEEDYRKAIESLCAKNYAQAQTLVNQRKYSEALDRISRYKRYNASYKNTPQLEIISVCEPLYQNAVTAIEAKNYTAAQNYLETLNNKSSSYKDMADLNQLIKLQQQKSFMLFEPMKSNEKELEDKLFNNFNQYAVQNLTNIKVINNTPFLYLPDVNDVDAVGNVDLIQAIRKATGTDYFYVFNVSNQKEQNLGPYKTGAKCFQEVKTKVNDTLTKTEYKPSDYNQYKAQRIYSYDFQYKLINAYSNQLISSQKNNIQAQDLVEYNELIVGRSLGGSNSQAPNINNYFPYNPQVTPPMQQTNPRKWRQMFTARKELRPLEELKTEADKEAQDLFTRSISKFIK
jgi:hypothetical protein